ncbi:MC063 [Molluscum contagiosum virus subtype 2]|nr:MC063 [Molluscum contagiosum virus subtype 2]AYO87698.1 MC063 [Molluscum contagiosum virus subtype 2]AYO87868.1 MC063 [Molluscum contagiosum virus subtype 2]AYO88038.1 MC063 [Molluscum contagiosum virus subtype 2]AYO88208.1 MC063 [Molluscum contagiosum virus subtype 2]
MQATTRVQSRRCSTWPEKKGVFAALRAASAPSSVCAGRPESMGAPTPRAPARPARCLELPLQKVSAPG